MSIFSCFYAASPDLEEEPEQIDQSYFGCRGKDIVQDMICYQQASCNYLGYYKIHKLYKPENAAMLNSVGDAELAAIEEK